MMARGSGGRGAAFEARKVLPQAFRTRVVALVSASLFTSSSSRMVSSTSCEHLEHVGRKDLGRLTPTTLARADENRCRDSLGTAGQAVEVAVVCGCRCLHVAPCTGVWILETADALHQVVRRES